MGPGMLVVSTRTRLPKVEKAYTLLGILPAPFTRLYKWHAR
jgi:hypothetical protein